MKSLNGDLVWWATIMIGGAGYLMFRLPTTAAEFVSATVTLSACCAAAGVLLLLKFRWSPELVMGLLMFMIGWGVTRGIVEGFTTARIGMTIAGCLGLCGYGQLRRAVRGIPEYETTEA